MTIPICGGSLKLHKILIEDGKAEEYFYKVLNMAKAKLCKCDGQSGSSTPFPSSIPSSIPSETVEPEMVREQINNNIANE